MPQSVPGPYAHRPRATDAGPVCAVCGESDPDQLAAAQGCPRGIDPLKGQGQPLGSQADFDQAMRQHWRAPKGQR